MYVGLLVFSFFLEFLQTYFMQWTGQKVMFDLRSQIFRHLQRMHVGFFDKNPVGRLVTRVTTDVDALNEMFTSGVVAIFEDVFVLAGIVVIMLQDELAAGADHLRRAAADPGGHHRSSASTCATPTGASAWPSRASTPTCRSTSAAWWSCSCSTARSAPTTASAKINASHMEAYKDAIIAYAFYYPVVEILSSIAIACVIWFGGEPGAAQASLTLGVLVPSCSTRSASSVPSRT